MKRRPVFAVFFLAALLTGCSIAQPFAKVDYYELDYPSPALKSIAVLDCVVGVRRFGIASAFDHDRLVEKEKDLRTTQTYYYRWVTNPRMMLSELLMRDLLASGGFKAVVMMPANVLTDYEINGFVQEILKDNSLSQSKVRVAMNMILLQSSLSPQEANRIVFQKTYASEKPCSPGGPTGVAKAMSAAYQEISERIQCDVVEQIKNCKPSAQPPAQQN